MSTISLKNVKLGDNPDPSKNFVLSVPAVADGTLSIKRENGTNVLSIDANGKAVIPGVVGTVAQVGGVPTGQVVERGRNANGEYVRFADGTQICMVISNFTAVSTVTWQFPAAFTYLTSAVVQEDFGVVPGYYRVSKSLPSPTSMPIYRFQVSTGNPSADAFTICCLVIGRWY